MPSVPQHHDRLVAMLNRVQTFNCEQAACRGMDPNVFHTERGESTKEAKAICGRCPIRQECLEFALENYESFGIWGGLSERERRRIRRARKAAA